MCYLAASLTYNSSFICQWAAFTHPLTKKHDIFPLTTFALRNLVYRNIVDLG